MFGRGGRGLGLGRRRCKSIILLSLWKRLLAGGDGEFATEGCDEELGGGGWSEEGFIDPIALTRFQNPSLLLLGPMV